LREGGSRDDCRSLVFHLDQNAVVKIVIFLAVSLIIICIFAPLTDGQEYTAPRRNFDRFVAILLLFEFTTIGMPPRNTSDK